MRQIMNCKPYLQQLRIQLRKRLATISPKIDTTKEVSLKKQYKQYKEICDNIGHFHKHYLTPFLSETDYMKKNHLMWNMYIKALYAANNQILLDTLNPTGAKHTSDCINELVDNIQETMKIRLQQTNIQLQIPQFLALLTIPSFPYFESAEHIVSQITCFLASAESNETLIGDLRTYFGSGFSFRSFTVGVNFLNQTSLLIPGAASIINQNIFISIIAAQHDTDLKSLLLTFLSGLKN